VAFVLVMMGLAVGLTGWVCTQRRQVWLHWAAIEAIKQLAVGNQEIEKVEARSEIVQKNLDNLLAEIAIVETLLDGETNRLDAEPNS
jgi:hypothetical protein